MKGHLRTLIILLAVAFGVSSISASDARMISIFKVEGDDVVMTKGTAKEYAAKEGNKLSDGYTLSTGKDSYCYIKMDEDSILKMDQQSKVVVSKASRNKLSLTVQSGGALVDAGKQTAGHVIETRVGNTGLTIRGTLFLIGREADDTVFITMLAGSGIVDGYELPAGASMYVYDDVTDKTYEIIGELDIADMDVFTLQTILEYKELLLETGIINLQTLQAIPNLIAEIESAAAALPTPTEIPAQIMTSLPTPTSAQAGGLNPAPTAIPKPTPTPKQEDKTLTLPQMAEIVEIWIEEPILGYTDYMLKWQWSPDFIKWDGTPINVDYLEVRARFIEAYTSTDKLRDMALIPQYYSLLELKAPPDGPVSSFTAFMETNLYYLFKEGKFADLTAQGISMYTAVYSIEVFTSDSVNGNKSFAYAPGLIYVSHATGLAMVVDYQP